MIQDFRIALVLTVFAIAASMLVFSGWEIIKNKFKK